ncbi:hypothetical protein Lal_00018887 [Lupinus albus]|nr:hypothetical protein Lal_00018887 [Lupinus albus]
MLERLRYLIVDMWARYYIRGKFYAGLHMTSCCEGLHSQMGRYIESEYNVTEFLHHFQRRVSRMRSNEVVENFKSSYGDELLQITYNNLEDHAASIYTRVVFKKFREVLLESNTVRTRNGIWTNKAKDVQDSGQYSSSMQNVDNATEEQVSDSVRVRAKGRVLWMSSRAKRGNQCGICREIGHNTSSFPNVVGSCSRNFENDFEEE